MNETTFNTVPDSEIVNPLTESFLNNIETLLPQEGHELLTKSGRINKEGRELSETLYHDFLKQSGGSYSKLLTLCKDAISELGPSSSDTRDLEMLRVIQSIRGKAVYNAHKVWVEHEFGSDEGLGDLSAANVMRYASLLQKSQNISAYEAAENIEKEMERFQRELAEGNIGLTQENDLILSNDIADIVSRGVAREENRRSILAGIKNAISTFTREKLPPDTRRKIITLGINLLTGVSILGGSVGAIGSLKRADASTRNPEVVELVKFENTFLQKAENILQSESEIPQITEDSGWNETESEKPASVMPGSNAQSESHNTIGVEDESYVNLANSINELVDSGLKGKEFEEALAQYLTQAGITVDEKTLEVIERETQDKDFQCVIGDTLMADILKSQGMEVTNIGGFKIDAAYQLGAPIFVDGQNSANTEGVYRTRVTSVSEFKVGDHFVVNKSSVLPYGHIGMVIEKGIDESGTPYIIIFDVNYNSDGRARVIKVTDENFGEDMGMVAGTPDIIALRSFTSQASN